MQELLTFIVQHIVTAPEDVVVTEMVSEDGQHVTLRLSVNPEDMGVVIGKQGGIARSLRNIMKVSAMKQGQRVYIDILESGHSLLAEGDEITVEAAELASESTPDSK